MQRWEYKRVESYPYTFEVPSGETGLFGGLKMKSVSGPWIGVGDNRVQIDEGLAALGGEGWELVAAVYGPTG
ncbi:MAG: hypothetical protein HW416_2579 [Chloroflexi bacterium]|nr:hypothetical protein [Chloroflexota bacterium]